MDAITEVDVVAEANSVCRCTAKAWGQCEHVADAGLTTGGQLRLSSSNGRKGADENDGVLHHEA